MFLENYYYIYNYFKFVSNYYNYLFILFNSFVTSLHGLILYKYSFLTNKGYISFYMIDHGSNFGLNKIIFSKYTYKQSTIK